VSIKFVEFTNAHTHTPVWVNPDHLRNVQAVPNHPEWTKLAMGGEGQDVVVDGAPKSVLEDLAGEAEIKFRRV
jgi:hypothetical protein